MSEEFPSEALDTPIEVSEGDPTDDTPQELPEGFDSNPDPSTLASFEDRFLKYNQLKDKTGQPLRTNQIYCLVKGDTTWDVLEQGSNTRQVKFTNFGRHFYVTPGNGKVDSRVCELRAPNIKKYLVGLQMSGTDVVYGGSLGSDWYFDMERRDSKGHLCYRVYTMTGKIIGGGGSMPGVPSYSYARVGLDKDNEWRSGSIKADFDIKFHVIT